MMRAVLAAGLVLAACTPQPAEAPLPDDLSPVDIADIQRNLIAGSPGSEAFGALSTSGKGVIFALDGTATYIDPIGDTVVETTVSGFTDNTMCVAQAGAWPGLCIDLYQTADGTFFCEGTFGDGEALNYACTLAPVARVE